MTWVYPLPLPRHPFREGSDLDPAGARSRAALGGEQLRPLRRHRRRERGHPDQAPAPARHGAYDAAATDQADGLVGDLVDGQDRTAGVHEQVAEPTRRLGVEHRGLHAVGAQRVHADPPRRLGVTDMDTETIAAFVAAYTL